MTPLHTACVNGHIDVVKNLIDAGANPFKRDRNGLKPSEVVHNPQYGIKLDRYKLKTSDKDNEKTVILHKLKKGEAKARALVFLGGLQGRLGSQSPLQLLCGFGHITQFIIIAHCLKAWDRDNLPELL